MKNINLIRYIAWSFHKTTGLPFDELFSEACLAYCEALNSFNPEKGKLNNYATSVMVNHLTIFVKIEKRYFKTDSFPEEPHEYIYVDNFLDLLPECIKPFAEMVLDNLEDVSDELSPIKARIKIKEIIINKGYKKKYVEEQIKLLRLILNKI